MNCPYYYTIIISFYLSKRNGCYFWMNFCCYCFCCLNCGLKMKKIDRLIYCLNELLLKSLMILNRYNFFYWRIYSFFHCFYN